MIEGRVQIPKVWRSECARLFIFFVALIVAVVLSRTFPASVITGKLFSIGKTTIYLSLPLFWLVPLFLFTELLYRMYNVWYVADSLGIEAWEGILSLKQSITRIRHEDVRSIETDQSLLDRILDVGKVQIGTAATGSFEVILQGVSNPKNVQRWLQAERDNVQKKMLQKSSGAQGSGAGSQNVVSSSVEQVGDKQGVVVEEGKSGGEGTARTSTRPRVNPESTTPLNPQQVS